MIKFLLFIFVILGLSLGWFLTEAFSFLVAIGLFLLATGVLLFERTSPGKPTRPDISPDSPEESCFIESSDGLHSCSFVEFDGRGDFLVFRQHQHCWSKIRKLGKSKDSRLVLVIYTHGWKNNSQSLDVVRFNRFLAELAKGLTQLHPDQNYRVHGVYHSWQGSLYRPRVNRKKHDLTVDGYGEKPLISKRWSSRLPWIFSWIHVIANQLTYWDVKAMAEHKVSGVGMARALYAYGKNAQAGPGNQTIVMGHSFGALVTEQVLANGITGGVSMELPWFRKGDPIELDRISPFDAILLLNSAAPSIYAKLFRDFLTSAYSNIGEDIPLVFSLTSKADGATRWAHRIANSLSHLFPSMKRTYEDLLEGDHPVQQSVFYKYTPGHNPLLINAWLRPAQCESSDSESPLKDNLRLNVTDPMIVQTQGTGAWKLDRTPQGDEKRFKGHTIIERRRSSSYWIFQCENDLIKNHGDIWNAKAMEVYAALFRIAIYHRTNRSQTKQPGPGF